MWLRNDQWFDFVEISHTYLFYEAPVSDNWIFRHLQHFFAPDLLIKLHCYAGYMRKVPEDSILATCHPFEQLRICLLHSFIEIYLVFPFSTLLGFTCNIFVNGSGFIFILLPAVSTLTRTQSKVTLNLDESWNTTLIRKWYPIIY